MLAKNGKNNMLKYKIVVLGSLSSPDREFSISCDKVVYEHEAIVFKKIFQKRVAGVLSNVETTVMAIPQGISIVTLEE